MQIQNPYPPMTGYKFAEGKIDGLTFGSGSGQLLRLPQNGIVNVDVGSHTP